MGSVEADETIMPSRKKICFVTSAVLDHERAGLLGSGEPLEELGELHRLEIASNAHAVGSAIIPESMYRGGGLCGRASERAPGAI